MRFASGSHWETNGRKTESQTSRASQGPRPVPPGTTMRITHGGDSPPCFFGQLQPFSLGCRSTKPVPRRTDNIRASKEPAPRRNQDHPR